MHKYQNLLQNIRGLAKPEYLFRPRQLILRLVRWGEPSGPDIRVIDLPWGAPVRVGIRDTIGLAIWRLGVYELVVSEVLWRLIDPGDAVVDVGANFGCIASLMAVRVGRGGQLTAFEPHPAIFEMLRDNVSMWRERAQPIGKIEIVSSAVSDRTGTVDLILPHLFKENAGTAFIRKEPRPDSAKEYLESIPVAVDRLDRIFGVSSRIPTVMKIDVEGNECQVLQGAGELITKRKIRDIVFEEHGAYPTPSMKLLEDCGYSLFKLKRSFARPLLVPPATKQEASPWEPANFLATTDPDRAEVRLKPLGWKCLRRSAG